jgi:uncharacterized membrane protein YhaH (DUF805 family)
MDHSAVAAASAVAALVFVYGIVALGIIVFMIWLYWRIFAKAGYSGALALLNFIPGIGHLICLIILAFSRWPIEDQLAMLERGTISPRTPPAPPGTSVMPTT